MNVAIVLLSSPAIPGSSSSRRASAAAIGQRRSHYRQRSADFLPLLQQPAFLEAFHDKGRFRDLMERVPVHVIVTRAAIMGAASHGLSLAEER